MSNYEPLDQCYDEIKEAYLFGVTTDDGITEFPSVKSLADSFNVSFSTLKKRAAKEKWSQQRRDIGSRISEKVHDKKSEYAAEKIVNTDRKFEETGLKARRLIDRKYDEIEQRFENGKVVYASEILLPPGFRGKVIDIYKKEGYTIIRLKP